ncbi:MAG: O-acetylhomoserine aminocarboxypropyltransferase/cysteine synthase [Clostridiaceae bacterium]|mgnify:CR=1 FL=1|nr:O-acetylhomoserine aminocarboxypropyltransferase/cysteine synthase [Clostridiaceae bacterium]
MTKNINTKCIHSGWVPKNKEPRQLPIYQSTTFKFDSSLDMAKCFDLEDDAYFYTRLQNPTNDAVAAKIADLEGGVAAILTSSGQAATFFSLINICKAGDHIISSSAIYGGSYNLIAHTLKDFGIDSTFVEPDCSPEELQAAFTDKTRVVFGETLANPALKVLDIETFAKVAHQNNVPLIVDNTFPTPIKCRPIEWGADIVVHSTTKYMDGHATSVGGVVVDSGNFDWQKHSDLFPDLTKPAETYHGSVFTDLFGKAAYIGKMTTTLMRDLGSIPSPQNSFLLNLGLETLHLRVQRHCENANKVANYLKDHEKISWIKYPDLMGDEDYDLAKKYLPDGSSGVVIFGVKGGRDAATKFMDNLELASIATHVADAKTCVLHPASTTHRQMNDSELEAAGVKPDLIRFSVGIEDVDDIIADLSQALAKI